MGILQDISSNLQIGKAKIVKTLVQQALDEGLSAQEILSDGLLDGMNKVGEQFKNNEIFVPEVLIAARAMSMGTAVLKPHLASEGVESRGKIVIGTVQGDLHDIGKNLVKMMIEGCLLYTSMCIRDRQIAPGTPHLPLPAYSSAPPRERQLLSAAPSLRYPPRPWSP